MPYLTSTLSPFLLIIQPLKKLVQLVQLIQLIHPSIHPSMSFFSLTDDLVLKILYNLEDDPRHLARLACVCTKLSLLIRDVCWKSKCSRAMPSVVSDLVSSRSVNSPPGGWAALHKLSVCCPGLHHAGVLLENSDFGLERELGPDQDYQLPPPPIISTISQNSTEILQNQAASSSEDCSGSWSLYDDLYFDTIYDVSETQKLPELPEILLELGQVAIKPPAAAAAAAEGEGGGDLSTPNQNNNKKRKKCDSGEIHLASGIWNLSREQGNKLLASRFRGDCLYICDWPGCMHSEEKRNYNLFRGIFRNFKKSQVWRTINDGNRSKITLDCAFCPCKETWDLHSAFCLRRVFGYHDNGEPVVRAYVCENGHVSGAWTERPMYS